MGIVSPGFQGRRRVDNRLPPGQYEESDFPVLSAGPTPRVPLDRWRFTITAETGHIFYEAGFANFHLHPPAEVHFKNAERAPLLIVGAEKDRTVPASLSHKQYGKYEKCETQTDYTEFAGRPHLMMIGEGWEEVAAGSEGWVDGVLDPSKAAPASVSA